MSAGIVIVGGGLAAAKTVTAYREAGGKEPLRMLTADSSFPYHRPPLSKRYLRGEIDASGTLVEQPDFYAQHDCRCDLETTVAAVHDSEVELSSGERVPFDRLVIASGASPRQLDVPGADLGGVYTLRTLANSTAIRERAAESRRAFIVGSNFIGLETAASLTQLGVEVTLCDRGDQLFRALETPAYSEYLRELYEEKGVELLFGDEVAEIRGDGRIASVVTRGGEQRDADLLIAGIGVVPNTSFVEGAGIDVDDGVLVNTRFETSRRGRLRRRRRRPLPRPDLHAAPAHRALVERELPGRRAGEDPRRRGQRLRHRVELLLGDLRRQHPLLRRLDRP